MAGVLGAGLLLLALVGGYVASERPELLDGLLGELFSEVPALTGHETTEPARTDYRLIYESMEALGPWLAENCAIEAGASATMVLTVTESGAISSVNITEGINEATDSCVSQALKQATLNRGQPGDIQCPKVMSW